MAIGSFVSSFAIEILGLFVAFGILFRRISVAFRTLEKEKVITTRLRQSLENARSGQGSSSSGDLVILDVLQAELDLEKSKVTELQNSLQREKNNVAEVTVTFDSLKKASREAVEREREICRQMKRELDDLNVRQKSCSYFCVVATNVIIFFQPVGWLHCYSICGANCLITNC